MRLQICLNALFVTEPPPCFTFGMIQGVAALSQHFAVDRPSYLSQRFRQSKGLYFTTLLSSFCAPWPTGAFEFFYSGFLIANLPYKPASQSLFLTVDVDLFFSILVQLRNDVWSSQPSIKQAGNSDEIVLCFWINQPSFWSSFISLPDVS